MRLTIAISALIAVALAAPAPAPAAALDPAPPVGSSCTCGIRTSLNFTSAPSIFAPLKTMLNHIIIVVSILRALLTPSYHSTEHCLQQVLLEP